ncbi:hypothetical protein Tco_1494482, partial [Tanacetum coccineum]
LDDGVGTSLMNAESKLSPSSESMFAGDVLSL